MTLVHVDMRTGENEAIETVRNGWLVRQMWLNELCIELQITVGNVV